MNISLSNGRLFGMDTTNVNSGQHSGLKQLLKHAVLLGKWAQGSPLFPDKHNIFNKSTVTEMVHLQTGAGTC